MLCPFCDQTLSTLMPQHPEYNYTKKFDDGTKKAYHCAGCTGVFLRDKINRSWEYSPKTYDLFLEKKLIKDFLAND